MINAFKLKTFVIMLSCVMIIIVLSMGIVSVVKKDQVPKPTYTIVVDAGHGGFDVK